MRIFILILMLILLIIIKVNSTENFKVNHKNKNIIEKVYFINLDKSVDRRKNLIKNALENNISISRFPGYYGKNLNKQKLYDEGIFDKFIFRTKDGMIGCTLSHLKLWEPFTNYIIFLKSYFIKKDF